MPFLDAAALEREAHMRATIVEGEEAPAVVDDEDRTMAAVHDEPSLRLQLLEASGKRELLVRRVHEHASAVVSLGRCWHRRSIITAPTGDRGICRPILLQVRKPVCNEWWLLKSTSKHLAENSLFGGKIFPDTRLKIPCSLYREFGCKPLK